MAFPDSFLDDLRSRLNLSDIVARRVQWDQRKSNPRKRDYWACCPFHGEKTPSFHVDDQKGRYYCFGCHVKGDHISFLMEQEGMDFMEAVRTLAELAGVEVPNQRPVDPKVKERQKTLGDVMEAAAQWLEGALHSEAGAQAMRYASGERHINPDLIKRFRVGFAPQDGGALRGALAKQGFTDEMMAEAGLVIVPEDGGTPFCRFRNRLTFAITDAKGQVVGFGGRDLSGRANAKYLNSPETPLFHKSRLLYNYRTAREAARKAGTIIVAEGYMDVVALARAGMDYAVAPMGTALTDDQLRLLWRTVAEPLLCFDGDEAGKRAAFRSLDLALPELRPGYSLRFVMLPEGKDPDDLLNEGGAGAVKKALEKSVSFADLLWQAALSNHQLETPEDKAAFKRDVMQQIRRIKDNDVREAYEADFSARLAEALGLESANMRAGGRDGGGGRSREMEAVPGQPTGLRQEWKFNRRTGRRMPVTVGLTNSGRQNSLVARKGDVSAARQRQEGGLLRLLVYHPFLIEEHLEEVSALHLSDPGLDKLLQAVLEVASEQTGLEIDRLKRHLTHQGMNELLERLDGNNHAVGTHFARSLSAEDARSRFDAQMADMRVSIARDEVADATRALSQDLTADNQDRLQRAKLALEQAQAAAHAFGE